MKVGTELGHEMQDRNLMRGMLDIKKKEKLSVPKFIARECKNLDGFPCIKVVDM